MSESNQPKKTVVSVWKDGVNKGKFAGTAFFISDRLLLTASHVIHSVDSDKVYLGGIQGETEIPIKKQSINFHPERDIALIKLEIPNKDTEWSWLDFSIVDYKGMKCDFFAYNKNSKSLDHHLQHTIGAVDRTFQDYLCDHQVLNGFSGGAVAIDNQVMAIVTRRHKEDQQTRILPLFLVKDWLKERSSIINCPVLKAYFTNQSKTTKQKNIGDACALLLPGKEPFNKKIRKFIEKEITGITILPKKNESLETKTDKEKYKSSVREFLADTKLKWLITVYHDNQDTYFDGPFLTNLHEIPDYREKRFIFIQSGSELLEKWNCKYKKNLNKGEPPPFFVYKTDDKQAVELLVKCIKNSYLSDIKKEDLDLTVVFLYPNNKASKDRVIVFQNFLSDIMRKSAVSGEQKNENLNVTFNKIHLVQLSMGDDWTEDKAFELIDNNFDIIKPLLKNKKALLICGNDEIAFSIFENFGKFGWCVCTKLVNDDDEEECKILKEFESKNKECSVLIIKRKTDSAKGTVAVFNNEGLFNSFAFKDSNDELLEELKKEVVDKRKVIDLVTSHLGLTLESPDQGHVFIGFDGLCEDDRYISLKEKYSLYTAKINPENICEYIKPLLNQKPTLRGPGDKEPLEAEIISFLPSKNSKI